MGYEAVRDEKAFVLSWPHPFTWESYPITGFDIVCRETESEEIIHDVTLNDTDILNEPVVSHTVDLPPCVPDCYIHSPVYCDSFQLLRWYTFDF